MVVGRHRKLHTSASFGERERHQYPRLEENNEYQDHYLKKKIYIYRVQNIVHAYVPFSDALLLRQLVAAVNTLGWVNGSTDIVVEASVRERVGIVVAAPGSSALGRCLGEAAVGTVGRVDGCAAGRRWSRRTCRRCCRCCRRRR